MEDLKKIALLVSFTFFLSCFQVQSQPAIQAAFAKSYESEQAGNYTKAIAELKPVYRADNYFGNIRLGWLYYLDKQNSISIQYYNSAISLKPYAI